MIIPTAWYNILADLDFTLPPDVPAEGATGSGLNPQVPLSLARQEHSTRPWVPIPEEVRDRYAQWRPTPLRRATHLERALGTGARIYYKYEGGNLTGSHKLNTAIAQAYYYRAAGATRLAVATGAGQWGTAVAAACQMFGLDCHIFMVRSSLEGKPHRRTLMELLGATVTASPSDLTETGRRYLADGERGATLSIALAEAVEETRDPGTRFCAGSGETYSLLHQTVIGLEAEEQLAELHERPDVVVAGLGAGSNFGGIAFPFLRSRLTGDDRVRCLSVEPAACPKLTRGRYAYDYTDSSEQTPLQKMYTLGYRFTPPAMHAGGLRYHATAKIISALYDRGLIEAEAYQQREIFSSAALFARCEGIVPAPESAHAVHGAVLEAARADARGQRPTILFSLSGHGMFDMAAYRSWLDGGMDDEVIPDEAIARSLAQLPRQPRWDAVPAA
ncbi:TrpB-like pyridoxal phosphate-dependent enzyme [Micromonospora sp. CPCC 205556]|uniref:TrpB-like pyridoxal phosphate-dependent enzyme n=1 Tax=Micromonospora sp. CPCC 205556 TaxID=3122398 RepID=UPI002FF08534